MTSHSEPESSPVAMVTGSSSGLGLVIAQSLCDEGYQVVLVGRDASRLEEARQTLLAHAGSNQHVVALVADVSQAEQVGELFQQVDQRLGRLDVLVNCVGSSDRGLAEKMTTDHLTTLIHANVHTALLCSQASLGLLESSGGVIVNIGSLAAKVGARYMGGYALAKHALAALSQQMRLELKPRGVHVGLVNPGPIQRQDAGRRYEDRIDESMPVEAAAPGGGARLKGLPPKKVARAVIKCIRRRQPDVVLPAHMRLMIGLGHAFPRLGDWLLLKFTSSKS